MTFTEKESLEAQKKLKALFKEYKTKTVFVVQRGVSRSGTTRQLDLYLLPSRKAVGKVRIWDEQISPQRITNTVARALRWVYNRKKETLTVRGSGMNTHFHTVYNLSGALYPEGFKVDGIGRNGDTSGWDNDGGYYLAHVSI